MDFSKDFKYPRDFQMPLGQDKFIVKCLGGREFFCSNALGGMVKVGIERDIIFPLSGIHPYSSIKQL